MNRRHPRMAALVLAAASGLAACGVGAQSSPRDIDRADVPFGLGDRVEEPTSSVHQAPYSYTIFLVADDRLRGVARGSRTPPTVLNRLTGLTRGPTPAEADAGLRTLLSPEVTVERVRVTDGVATVVLSADTAAQPVGDEGALGIAQLVYTATAVPGVERVRFQVGGEPAEVPRGNGTLTDQPVGRGDYAPATP